MFFGELIFLLFHRTFPMPSFVHSTLTYLWRWLRPTRRSSHFRPFIPPLYSSPLFRPFIPPLYSSPLFIPFIHPLYSSPLFLPFIPPLYSSPLFIPFIPPLYSSPLFIPFIPPLYSSPLFIPFIHPLYSSPLFTPFIPPLYSSPTLLLKTKCFSSRMPNNSVSFFFCGERGGGREVIDGNSLANHKEKPNLHGWHCRKFNSMLDPPGQ